jgi:hypothetical protein
MTDPAPPLRPTSDASVGAPFAPTEWSIILETRRDSANRRPALEKLCSAYWLPIYGYLRRRGHAPADAEDLTQGFSPTSSTAISSTAPIPPKADSAATSSAR